MGWLLNPPTPVLIRVNHLIFFSFLVLKKLHKLWSRPEFFLDMSQIFLTCPISGLNVEYAELVERDEEKSYRLLFFAKKYQHFALQIITNTRLNFEESWFKVRQVEEKWRPFTHLLFIVNNKVCSYLHWLSSTCFLWNFYVFLTWQWGCFYDGKIFLFSLL